MEQVTLSTPATYVHGNPALLLSNIHQSLNLSSYLNDDIVQQALSGINNQIPVLTHANAVKVSCEQNGFFLDKNGGEERVVQLSISDDFPLTMSNLARIEGDFSNNDQHMLSDDVLSCNEKTENSSDSLNSLLQLPPDNRSNGTHDTTSASVKGCLTYAYQLSNTAKISQVSSPLTLSTTSNVVASVPTVFSAPIDHSPNQSSNRGNLNAAKYVILRGVKPRLVLNLNKSASEVKSKSNKVVRLNNGKIVDNSPRPGVNKKKALLPPKKQPRREASHQSPLELHNNKELTFKAVRPSILLTSLPDRNVSDDQEQDIDISEGKNSVLEDPNHAEKGKVFIANYVSQPGDLEVAESLLVGLSEVPSGTDGKNCIPADSSSESKKKSVITSFSKPKASGIGNSLFDSIGRCSEDQLKKLQTAFQNGELLYYDEGDKIVCKLLYPEDFSSNADEKQVKSVDKSVPENKKEPKKKKGRPPLERPIEEELEPPKKLKKRKKVKLPCTRSGRLSRPPRHMAKDFKKLGVGSSDISTTDSETEDISDIPPARENIVLSLDGPARRFRQNYRCPTCGKNYPGRKMLFHLNKYPDHGDPDSLHISDKKKHIFAFNSFKKLFARGKQLRSLEPNILKEFLKCCPDGVLKDAVKERACRILSPWEYLFERQPAGEGGVKGLLSDLSSIINAIPPNILEKTELSDPNAIEVNDERLCQILKISPGRYLTKDKIFKPRGEDQSKVSKVGAPAVLSTDWPSKWSKDEVSSSSTGVLPNETIPPNGISPLNEVMTTCESQSANLIRLSEVISTTDITPVNKESSSSQEVHLFTKDENSLDLDKKVSPDLSDILLDKSSIDTVDEILNDRLNELMPLDVPSLGETQALARSIFSSNSLDLHGVSGSTEDLLKSLENLAPELPPVAESADFDFAVLSTDFGTDR